MPEKSRHNSYRGRANAASSFDVDMFHQQLVDLSNDESRDNYANMINLINESKKAKLSQEERTPVNIAAILIPFVMVNHTTVETVNKLKVSVEKEFLQLEGVSLSPWKTGTIY